MNPNNAELDAIANGADAQEKLRIAREALERAHLLTCDETKIDERCFICEALEKTK